MPRAWNHLLRVSLGNISEVGYCVWKANTKLQAQWSLDWGNGGAEKGASLCPFYWVVCPFAVYIGGVVIRVSGF